MRIRVSQYSGTAVTNSATAQFVQLEDPSISEFHLHKIEGTASYEATVGENLTYEHFVVDYEYGSKKLLWTGLQLHELLGGKYVTKLTEDKFLADEFYYSIQDSSGNLIPTFGIGDNQINLSDSNDFKHSHLKVYREAFCGIDDVQDILRSEVSGRITIGEKHTDINANIIGIKDVYRLIREAWAEMSTALSYRYKLPIRVQRSSTEEFLKIVSAKKVAYEIYVMLYPNAKFGDRPNAVYRWREDYKKFLKDIGKRPLNGIANKISNAGGSFRMARS